MSGNKGQTPFSALTGKSAYEIWWYRWALAVGAALAAIAAPDQLIAAKAAPTDEPTVARSGEPLMLWVSSGSNPFLLITALSTN